MLSQVQKSERCQVEVEKLEGDDRCIEYKRSVPGTGVVVSNTSNGAMMLSGGEEKRKKV